MTHRSAIAGQGGGAWTPPAGLVGWWYGDSLTNGAWTDRLAGGNHADLFGDASVGSDGILLDGVGDYAKASDSGFPSGVVAALTVLFWCRPIALVPDMTAISYGTAQQSRAIGINYRSNTKMRVLAYLNDANGASTTTLAVNAWQHRGFSLAGSSVTYWTGGATDGIATMSATPNVTANALWIGMLTGILPWSGYVDDVQIYASVLSASEVADIMANSPGSHAA